ncbi:GGDEF domain-containing protein [Thiorhodospira sibirica]|uniref:GGDEF domain-containing protein n=1 Tax=Thiorhodospira sibirica TaxID=154347 RepID=UPI00022C054F|nr:DUF484 family protein [Thiorhodospira sibirica]
MPKHSPKHPSPSSKETLQRLISQAKENQRTMDWLLDLELRLVAALDLPTILSILLNDLRIEPALDYISVALLDVDGEIAQFLAEVGYAQDDQRVMLLSNLQAREMLRSVAFLGDYKRTAHGLCFNQRADLGSIAILPLWRTGKRVGQLHLGSHDPTRYQRGIERYFLNHLASITCICIENALNVRRLRELGVTDALTGVRNRRYFAQRYLDELGKLHRDGGCLSCLMLDIDHFKRVNDTYGHPAGDEAIRQVAHCITQHLRVFDLVARYGGEEFVLLLPGLGAQEATTVAERIRRAVESLTIELDTGEHLNITLSVGLACLNTRPPSAAALPGIGETLLQAADNALLEAKRTGRNRLCVAA